MTLTRPAHSQTDRPSFDIHQTQKGVKISFKGSWLCAQIGSVETALKKQVAENFLQKSFIEISFEKNCVMDTAGACLVAQAIKTLKEMGNRVIVEGEKDNSLLTYFLHFRPEIEIFPPRLDWKVRWLDRLGLKSILLGKTTRDLLTFLGEVLVTWAKTFRSGASVRWVSVAHHCQEIGVRAFPIIALISFLIGMVLAYQSINQLRRFGAEIYSIDFLGVAILREIAALLTAIVIAGRSGSAFTAQIGTMALNQEIDAIRMMGLSPFLTLVVPRFIAMIVCLPILVFFSMIIALLGGMVALNVVIEVSPFQFLHHLQRAVSLKTFWVGFSKAPVFGILIALIGCFRGFQVKGSAESVGRMTTQSVVESIFLVIVCDALMSILFSYLKV